MSEPTVYSTSPVHKKGSGAARFSPGDVLAVGLPGGGYGLVIVGRLNADRMFCTSVGPRFEEYPTDAALEAWQPEFWSSWVADTLGLRDGSWVKVKKPDSLANLGEDDILTMPRFAFENKDGDKKLAEYDPDTLHVRAVVDATDLEEYEGAPNYFPQDATSFEVFLSNTLMSPCELPDRETVERLNAEREVVAQLRELVTDVRLVLVFDHVFVFKNNRDAKRARQELAESGFDVAAPVRSELFGPTTIEVKLRSKAEYPLVKEDVKRMRQLAAQYGADYDGFGALAG